MCWHLPTAVVVALAGRQVAAVARRADGRLFAAVSGGGASGAVERRRRRSRRRRSAEDRVELQPLLDWHELPAGTHGGAVGNAGGGKRGGEEAAALGEHPAVGGEGWNRHEPLHLVV